jgi:hypothetical protein
VTARVVLFPGCGNGRLLWKKKIDDHAAARITGAAVVQEEVVYVPVASAEETSARGEKRWFVAPTPDRSTVGPRPSMQ